MIGNTFPFILLFFLLAIFNLTDQVIELTDENGTGKFISSQFFVPKQCYGTLGESASGSYRIQFRVVGKGHCHQLDPNALTNGLELEIGYYLPNNLEANPWIKQCPINDDEHDQWHGIYVDADGNIINLTLSFHDQSFPINARNFFLELANPSDSSLTTKLHTYNSDSKLYENKEFDEHIHQKFFGNQHRGAHPADFVGLWALALDLLPSNLDHNKIKIFTLSSRNKRHAGKHDTCDVNSGNMVKDNCTIQAWFLEPSDGIIPDQIDENVNNNSCIMDKKLPFIDESFLENPLKIGDIIHITGRMNDNFQGNFYIHLLHNWTEPDSIMGETILKIRIRRNYINLESRYNFTEHKPPSPDTIEDIFGQSLDKDIDKKFSLNIDADPNGNYKIILNCKNDKAFIFTQANDNPLKYTSTNYIRIEADQGVELHCYQIIRKPSTIITPPLVPDSDPSYSLKLDYTDKKDMVIIAKLELPKNATKFDINLIYYDDQWNNASILVHLHANLDEIFYIAGKCSNDCPVLTDNQTINASEIGKPVASGQQFFWVYVQNKLDDGNNNNQIFIDDTKVGMTKTNETPNYIQFKGGLILLDLLVEPIVKEYPFADAFKPFNQITIFLKMTSYTTEIRFECLDEQKCEKSLNISMVLYIKESNTNYMELSYYSNNSDVKHSLEESLVYKNMDLPENRTLQLSVYANQFEYQFFNGDELIFMANYWQFPTPDKFDTIAIYGQTYFLEEKQPLKEWKQFKSDIVMPFSYRLDKPLEIGSKIKIIMKFEKQLRMSIYLQNNSNQFHEHFGINVLSLDIFAYREMKTLFIKVGRKDSLSEKITKNSTIYEFGDLLKFEIIVYEEYYQIILDGKIWFNNITHMLPVGMVNFMRIEEKYTKGEIIETKITWPSDSDNSSNWLTTPVKKQFEVHGPLSMPLYEPLIMRLNRPLRINDAILFKGKFHNGLNEFRELSIELLRDIPTRRKPFKILWATFDWNWNSDNTVIILSSDKFYGDTIKSDRGTEWQIDNPENDTIDMKIHVDENIFVVQIGNTTKTIENAGLFWAVDYIKFYFDAGLKEQQNIDMEEGYPKIVHEYDEKDD